jgi:arylsulfatase A-like enzyme
LLISSILCGLLLPAASAPPPSTPRSLLLISLDTTRADHLHCYGYPLPTSPAIDALAAGGILFERAFTQAVNTGPAHATLLTGLAPIAHGVRFNGAPLSSEFTTLSVLLSGAGYKTAAFVSGYTMMAAQTGFDRGFEVYNDQFTGQERRSDQTVDLALAWLKSVPAGKPYFLFVHLFDPHGRYDPPEGGAAFRKGSYEPIPAVDEIPEYQRLERKGGGVSLDPLDYISRYDAEIAHADSQIKRLLEGAGDRAVIAFTSDHGETLVERGYYFSHGAMLTDEALRIPLIVRTGDSKLKGKRIRGTAQLVDVMPTLLSALHQKVPDRLPGRNLLPFARAGAIPPGTVVISEARATPQSTEGRSLAFPPRSLLISARSETSKLISYPSTAGLSYGFFDLASDPLEKSGSSSSEKARASSLFTSLDLYRNGGRLPDPPEPDEETKKKLRSLGYID